jgi:imidazolonepropionase
VIRHARVVTPAPGTAGARRGREIGRLQVLDNATVLCAGGRIDRVEPGGAVPAAAVEIDARGRVLLPAFVDCHTHACWAGDRLDEWEMKRKGASYLDILRAGGGIMSTVRAVRAASREALAHDLRSRLDVMLNEGTTTVEVKSGYGLTTDDELKMVRAIRDAAATWPGTVVPTALLGHAIDPAAGSAAAFVDRVIEETLPAVSAEFPGIAVDAFCENGAWSLADCARLFERARAAGHPIRVHADQFTALGMLEEAVRLGAVSVDHLEASTPQGLVTLAASAAVGVLLPCCGFHLDGRYAGARPLVDGGGAVALATNLNPGSAPCSSIPMAVALAVRHCGLSASEAITAATANAAAVLGMPDRGIIAPGARADLVLLRHRDERLLAYEFGGDPVDAVVCGGRVTRPDRAG